MTTTAAHQARTAALRAARTKDSTQKRQQVVAAIETLETAGLPITFTAVATTAGVSTWPKASENTSTQPVYAKPPTPCQHRAAQRTVSQPPQRACEPISLSPAKKSDGSAPNATCYSTAYATKSASRSKDQTNIGSSPESLISKPSTVNLSPNETPAPSRHTQRHTK